MTAPTLEVRRLRKRYGQRIALRGVDLAIAPGQIAALVGRNGAGKSTLVQIVAGLLRPDGGDVRVLGRDPGTAVARDRRLVGVAPQDIGVYPDLTVAQNLRFAGELMGLAPRRARRRAIEVAEPFGLGGLLSRRAGQTSGGERRRLHAAMAIVNRPRLLLLDEPTAGADPQTRNAILEVVAGLAAGGAAILYTTHYLPEVERLGATVSILHRGRVVDTGSVEDLVARHGESALVLTFDDGDRLRLPCEHPAAVLADVLARLGDHARRLRSVEVVRASFEDVFLRVTGEPAGAPAGESADEPLEEPDAGPAAAGAGEDAA